MTWQVIHGDCVEVMAEMAESSIDAIVTDPPYNLGFMAKDWDRFNAFQEFMREFGQLAMYVLKPGGHLLAFGGTRTYHRMASGLEDAGFEIRDCLAWMYGSGFPKSLDVSKAIDKRRDDAADGLAVGAWLKAQRIAAGFKQKDVAALWPSATGGLTGCVANWETLGKVPTWDQWLMLKEFIGFGDEMDAEVWRLNGRKGTPGEAWDRRPITQEAARPLVSGEVIGFDQRGSSERERRDNPATPEAQRWQGWGTALKPAYEPVVLARKPLQGTVAANVIAHGTGALNIDGTRIGTSPEDAAAQMRALSPGSTAHTGGALRFYAGREDGTPNTTFDPTRGRWPANVVLDDEAAALLDEQSGERPAGTAVRRNVRGQATSGFIGRQPDADDLGYGDTGGASRFFKVVGGTANTDTDGGVRSWFRVALETIMGPSDSGPFIEVYREHGGGYEGLQAVARYALEAQMDAAVEHTEPRFFYTAKADRAERNRGLEHRDRNVHPTVKPIDLMQWLCRLVTPPNGTVLDPFLGSGTTAIAALREGFNVIGIEREPDYVEIARDRIIGDAPLLNVGEEIA